MPDVTMATFKGFTALSSYIPFTKVSMGENISAVTSKSGSNVSKAKECLPYINDLASSTVQQIFVRSSLPVYTPLDPVGPDATTEPNYHSCEDCGDRFLFASSLAFHVNRYSVSIKFNCEYCSRHLKFFNRCNFLAHLRLHNSGLSEEELAALDITSQPIHHNKIPNNFNITDYLNPEINSITVDPSKPYCVECKENVEGTFKQHYVGTEKPISGLDCSKCSLILPTECSLSAHIRSHSQLSPFVCPDCAIEFDSYNLLSKHMTSECFHTFKLVRYKCERCVCMFTKPDNLFSHIVSQHLKCSLLTCQECPHYFKICKDYDNSVLKSVSHPIHCQFCCGVIFKTDVETHVMAHVNNPSYQKYAYKCTKCNYSCENVIFYRRHITQQHPKTFCVTKVVYDVETQRPHKKTTAPNASMPVINCVPKTSILRPHLMNRDKKAHQDPPTMLNVDTMPLTPSPEPLIEEDPLLLDSPIAVIKPVEVVNRTRNTNTNGYSSIIHLDATSSTVNPASKANILVKRVDTDLTSTNLIAKNPTKSNVIVKRAHTELKSTNLLTPKNPTKDNVMVKRAHTELKSTNLTAKNPTKDNLMVKRAHTDLESTNFTGNNPPIKANEMVNRTDLPSPSSTEKKPPSKTKTMTILRTEDISKKYLHKRHQCTRCNEFIYFDGTLNPVERHFAANHPNYEVAVTKERVPTNSTVNGRSIILVTQKFKITKKNSSLCDASTSPQKAVNENGMKKPSVSNGLVKTDLPTITNNYKTVSKNINRASSPIGPQTSTNKINPTFKGRSSTNFPRTLISNKHFSSKAQRLNKQKLARDNLYTVKHHIKIKSGSDSSLKRKLKRPRKKKMLDPDFVSNDSDSDYKLAEDPSYSDKTPPRLKVEQPRKRYANEDTVDGTPTRTKKQKRKSTGGVAGKTGSPEAPGSGLVISPSKHDENSSFVCAVPMCQFTSRDRDIFREHITTHRIDKNSFQCMECGICFVVKPTFTKHLFIYHQISDAELYILNNNCCDEGLICRQIDFNDYQKIREQNIPTVLMEFQCNICYKPCDDAWSLNSHFRTHGMAFLRSQFMKKCS